eukprot:scaffold52583_cov58-Phaeocystis_antarctica.AAC.3
MRKLLKQLPSDAVEQINAKIPLDKKTGKPKYPKNKALNGYVQQLLMAAWEEKDNLAVCERLLQEKSPHVGEATVFVSWFLDTPIDTLLDALANFLKQKGLREEDTFFWVCDYVIRQTNVGPDLALLGECVSAVGHTVLLMEPWHAPVPLKRAYCIKEVYYTQKSRAQFDVVMSSAQQAAFEAALVKDFDSIQTSLSEVDVRTATCRNPEDTKAILDELEKGVGFVACNTLVIGLLREALVAQARAALARLLAAKRGTSALLGNLGMLLMEMGRQEEARPLFEEALQARRETLGDRQGPAEGGEAAVRGGAAGEEGDAGRPPPEHIDLDQQHGRAAAPHGQAGGGEAAVRGGVAGAEGDAGRPPPEHADLDQQHGPAAAGHGPAGGGEAAVRGGTAGEEGDAGRPSPTHADLDQQHGRAAGGHGPAGGGEAAVRGGTAGEEGDAGRPPPGHADLDLLYGRATGKTGHARRSGSFLHGGARGPSCAPRHGVSGDVRLGQASGQTATQCRPA